MVESTSHLEMREEMAEEPLDLSPENNFGIKVADARFEEFDRRNKNQEDEDLGKYERRKLVVSSTAKIASRKKVLEIEKLIVGLRQNCKKVDAQSKDLKKKRPTRKMP
jgi:hypothetical protein